MRVKITSGFDNSDKVIVDFECKAGVGRAVLNSNFSSDLIGRELSAELDIEVPLLIGENCSYDNESIKRIMVKENQSVLLMTVESQDDDGMAYCRLSEDCIIMVEVAEQEKLPLGSMIRIEIPVEDIRLTLI